MNREEAQQEAQELRRAQIYRVLDDPDTHWPDFSWRGWARPIQDTDGVTKSALARALGCSNHALDDVPLPAPVGSILTSAAGVLPIYDPDLLFRLRDHPKVVASRWRRLASVTDRERTEIIDETLSTSDHYELCHVIIENFRSLQHTAFEPSGLSVLFGKNGAGKSSILDAVRLGLAPTQPAAPADIPNLTVGIRFSIQSDDVLVASAYIALGAPTRLRNYIEDLATQILAEPIVLGYPGHWTLAVDPHVAGRVRSMAELIAHRGPRLRSRVLLDMVEATSSAVDLPAPVRSVSPNGVAPITVSTLRSDPVTLEQRLFDDIATSVVAFLAYHRTPALTYQGVEDDEGVEDNEGGDAATMDATTFTQTSKQESPIELRWVTDDATECPPHLASAVMLSSPDTGDEIIPIADLSTFRDRLERTLNDELAMASSALAILARLSRMFGGGRATSPWARTRLIERQIAVSALLATETLANRYAPTFALGGDRILCTPPSHETASRVQVDLLEPTGNVRSLSILPSGIARWIALATDLAAANVIGQLTSSQFQDSIQIDDAFLKLILTDDGDSIHPSLEASLGIGIPEEALEALGKTIYSELLTSSERSMPLTLLVADEPELHLHPAAQEEIVQWCRSTAARWTTLVATHAPAFLQLAPGDGQLIRVFRHPTEGTKAVPLEVSILEELDELSESLGLGKRDRFLQVYKGLLFVEGLTDRKVLLALAGQQLARNRLVTVPIHGHTKTDNVVLGELALAIGMPVAILFDAVTQADVELLSTDPSAKVSETAHSAWLLLKQVERGLDCTIIPFEGQDICRALPEETIRRRYPKFKSWSAVEESWRSNVRLSFKKTFMDAIEVPRDEHYETIVRLAQAWNGTDPLPAAIQTSLRRVDEWAASLSAGT